jgi:hypothetical protein
MDTPAWFAREVAVRSVEAETGITTLAFTIAGIPVLCGGTRRRVVVQRALPAFVVAARLSVSHVRHLLKPVARGLEGSHPGPRTHRASTASSAAEASRHRVLGDLRHQLPPGKPVD